MTTVIVTRVVFRHHVNVHSHSVVRAIVTNDLTYPHRRFRIRRVVSSGQVLPFAVVNGIPKASHLSREIRPNAGQTNTYRRRVLMDKVLYRPMAITVTAVGRRTCIIIVHRVLRFFRTFNGGSNVLLRFKDEVIFVRVPRFAKRRATTPPVTITNFRFTVLGTLERPTVLLFRLFNRGRHLFNQNFRATIGRFHGEFLLQNVAAEQRRRYNHWREWAWGFIRGQVVEGVLSGCESGFAGCYMLQ